jgi:acyl carrier protein
LPVSEALQLLRDHLVTAAAAILQIGPDAIDPDRPLQELGLDSMMAVELRGQIHSATGCDCPASLLFDYPTIERLAEHLGEALFDPQPSAASDVADDLDDLSEAQLAALLAGELDAVSRSISR